jgi:hypothetical protein
MMEVAYKIVESFKGQNLTLIEVETMFFKKIEEIRGNRSQD